MESISDGVFTVDGEWRVTSFNRAAEKITGVPRKEAIKQSFAEKTGGHLTCKAIRAAKSMSCSGCVEVAAELLEQHSRKV